MRPPPDPRQEARRRGRRARVRGRRGERLAARHLRRRGYRIHARNLRTPRGEVDLLAEEGGCLVLVEVKTLGPGRPHPAHPPLRHAQRRRLRAAAAWLRRGAAGRGRRIRLDVVVVTLDGRRSLVTIRRDVLRR